VVSESEDRSALFGFLFETAVRRENLALVGKTYGKAESDVVRKQIETVMNAQLDHFSETYVLRDQIVSCPAMELVQVYLDGEANLPDSTLIRIAKFLGTVKEIESLSKVNRKTESVAVKKACKTAFQGMIAAFKKEGSCDFLVQRGQHFPEELKQERDAALIAIIGSWAKNSQTEQIVAFIESFGDRLSAPVKASAENTFGKSVSEIEFMRSLDVLAKCGELCFLTRILLEEISFLGGKPSRTQALIESAMIRAMDVAITQDWVNPDREAAEYIWKGHKVIRNILESGCSEKVKAKARESLKKCDILYGTSPPVLTAKEYKEIEVLMPDLGKHRRRVKSYAQSRRLVEDLKKGIARTIHAPKETSDQKQRRLRERRPLC